MVICKSYAEKLSCQKLKVCPDEHINVKQYVKAEMEAAINGNQWPLSCFGPFSDKPSVPNYIDDQSFEEIRFMYYNTDKYSFFESCQKFTEAIRDAKEKMKMLNVMNKEVVDVLIDVYDYVEPSMKVKYAPALSFGTNQVKLSSSVSGRCIFKGSAFPPPPPNPTFSVFPKDCDVKKSIFCFESPPSKSVHQADDKKDNKLGFFDSNPFSSPQEKLSIFSTTNIFKLPESQDKKSGFFSSPELQKLQVNAFSSPKSGEEVSTQTEAEKRECQDSKDDIKELMVQVNALLSATNLIQEKVNEQNKSINSLKDSLKQIVLRKESIKPKHNTTSGNEPAIRIKPKFKQSGEKTKEEIKSILSPFGYFNLGLQVSSMLKSSNSSVIIRCKNKESVEKIEEEIAKACVERYCTERVKLATPKILVNGIDFDIDEDNLIEIIRKQNKIEGHISLVRSFERANVHKYSAVLEVDKNVYWSIMRESEPHLYVGWNKCIVFENVDIKKCYNCWGYNHHSRSCRNEKRCPRCAGQHTEDECTSQRLRCANCSMANLKLNLKLDLEHDVRSYQCYVYLSKVEKERKMIDY